MNKLESAFTKEYNVPSLVLEKKMKLRKVYTNVAERQRKNLDQKSSRELKNMLKSIKSELHPLKSSRYLFLQLSYFLLTLLCNLLLHFLCFLGCCCQKFVHFICSLNTKYFVLHKDNFALIIKLQNNLECIAIAYCYNIFFIHSTKLHEWWKPFLLPPV